MGKETETNSTERNTTEPQQMQQTTAKNASEIKTIIIPIKVKERPRRARANAAINIIKKQISKNLGGVETSKIVIGESINMAVFARGRERPPATLNISIKKIKGKYYTELTGIEIKQKIIEKKTTQQKKPQGGMAEMLTQMKKKAGIAEEEKPKESSVEKGKKDEEAGTVQEIRKKESEKVDKEIKKK